jgi:hypothetical protein
MVTLALPVQPLSEVRKRLSETLARFSREGMRAKPVIFGAYRKPQAIVLPYEAYEAMVDRIARLEAALDAARSVQVELPGAFSMEHEQAVADYVAGEIDENEMYQRTLDRYRQV